MSPARHTGHPDQELDLGHPVRSFVAVMVMIGVALVALQWSGLVVPRLSAPGAGVGERQGSHLVHVEVQNDGPLAVEVIDAQWPSGVLDAELGLLPAPSAELEPFAPFTLDSGESGLIGLEIPTSCGGEVGTLELLVRSPAGVHRWITFEHQQQSIAGAC